MTTSKYRISYADGSPSDSTATYEEAHNIIRAAYPDAAFAHDGNRTLYWPSEADSIDDDGARAVASITEVRS